MHSFQNFIQNNAGIELHLHAEGAIPKDFLWTKRSELDQKLTREQFDAEFNYSNFKDFVKHWCQHQQLLFSSPEKYQSYEKCNDLRSTSRTCGDTAGHSRVLIKSRDWIRRTSCVSNRWLFYELW